LLRVSLGELQLQSRWLIAEHWQSGQKFGGILIPSGMPKTATL
jgi:hypothetical protein